MVDLSILRYMSFLHSEIVIKVADLLQFLTLGITFFGYLPQIRRLYIVRSSKEMSTATWALWTAGSVIGFFYALVHHINEGCCLALACTTLLNALFSFVVLFLIVYFKTPKEEKNIPMQT